MYTVISIYAGGRVGGLVLALNCHPKATNKEQNILTMVVMRAVMRRGIAAGGGQQSAGNKTRGGQTTEERKVAAISCAKTSPHEILSTRATQSSPQLPRPNATRAILFNGNEILLVVM